MNDLELISLFCAIDDQCKGITDEVNKIQTDSTSSQRWWTTRKPGLALSEIVTITCLFHKSRYRTFKDFYLCLVLGSLKVFFPKVPSYSRFVSLMKGAIFPLFLVQHVFRGDCSGVSFIDSSVLSVCHICRSRAHKTFRKIAKKGKTSTGWFYGMKIHLIVNHQGEILAWMLTSGNISDLNPVESLCNECFGKLIGDKGYISSTLFRKLFERGIQLITRIRSSMKNCLMDLWDKALLKKRSLIESVFNQLKHGCQIEHHRHRSPINFLVNLIAGLVSYSLSTNKPTLEFVMS
jgi:transposase